MEFKVRWLLLNTQSVMRFNDVRLDSLKSLRKKDLTRETLLNTLIVDAIQMIITMRITH